MELTPKEIPPQDRGKVLQKDRLGPNAHPRFNATFVPPEDFEEKLAAANIPRQFWDGADASTKQILREGGHGLLGEYKNPRAPYLKRINLLVCSATILDAEGIACVLARRVMLAYGARVFYIPLWTLVRLWERGMNSMFQGHFLIDVVRGADFLVIGMVDEFPDREVRGHFRHAMQERRNSGRPWILSSTRTVEELEAAFGPGVLYTEPDKLQTLTV